MLCMAKKWVVSMITGAIFLQAGIAQKDAHALQNALKGKQLVLRSYAAVPVANYSWDNGKLITEPVTVHTFGVFATRSVKLKDGKLIIEGRRATMVRNTKTNAPELNDATPMRLTVDMHGADVSTVLPALQEMMFFSDVQGVLAGLPQQIANTLDISPASKTSCKCKWIFDGSKWLRVDAPTSRFVAPKVLFSTEPDFSEKARQKKISGNVPMFIYVSETGHVTDIWLASSAGYGLDEKAEEAARQYVFKPATYDGKPVKTMLNLEMNFQVF